MSVKKASNGTWMYDIRHPGTKQRKRVTGFPTKGDADQARSILMEKWRNAKHGTRRSTSKARINAREELKIEAELLSREWTDYFSRLQRTTALLALRFADFIPASLSMNEVSNEHLRDFNNHDLKRGIKTGSARMFVVGVLKVLGRIKERNGDLLRDWEVPTYRAKSSQTGNEKLRRLWTPEELNGILTALRNPQNYPEYKIRKSTKAANYRDVHDFLCIAATTGMRRTEVLTLEWSKVYFQWEVLHSRSLKKKSKVAFREIPMEEDLIEVLRERKKLISKQYGLGESLVFPRWRTDPYARWLYTTLKEVCDHLGIAYGGGSIGVVPHGLRHTAATMMLAGGTDIATAADILGNTPMTMLKSYAHTTAASKRRAVTNLNLPKPGLTLVKKAS